MRNRIQILILATKNICCDIKKKCRKENQDVSSEKTFNRCYKWELDKVAAYVVSSRRKVENKQVKESTLK